MKLLFISDIHGIKTNLPLIKEEMRKHECDKLVVLGDLYYSSPYNEMIEEYDPKQVEEFLESYKDRLICVKGNCDSELDLETSNFDIVRDITHLEVDDLNLYFTHGHLFNETNWKEKNTVLVFGHYHVPFILEKEDQLFINPGSISLPHNHRKPSYGVWDGKEFIIYDIDGEIIAEKRIERV